MARVEEHLEELLKLPADDRAQAAKVLLTSLDGDVDADAEGEWGNEIERRLAKIDAGQATLIGANEAIARLYRAARRQ